MLVKNTGYIDDLLEETWLVLEGVSTTRVDSDTDQHIPPPLSDTCTKPDKATAIQSHVSRFKSFSSTVHSIV